VIATAMRQIAVRLRAEAYTSWSVAQNHCEQALCAWSEAAPHARGTTSAAYRAALEREEAAARDLERLSRLTRTPL
jgi:hypothetical protein